MLPVASQPKRLLMTADTGSGVWTYALELARALSAQGVQVVLATMGRPLSPQQRREIFLLPNTELCESTYKLEWMPEPWREVEAAGQWLLTLEQQFQPDVIHLNGYVHAALPWHAPKLVVGHSCVLSWWRAVNGHDAPTEWNCYRRKVTTGLRAADLVVAPSAAMLELLDFHYGPLGPSRVIHNGRRLAGLRLRPKEHFIFCAGRLGDRAKNCAALADIAPELPWPVCIAGEQTHPARQTTAPGTDRPLSLDSPLVQDHPEQSPIYLGRLAAAELVPWFEHAAIYALPARYEPFGLSVLEAAQAGCALVLSDLPGLREVWADAAVFVSINHPDELKDALNAVIASPLWRAELGRRAQARAQHYSPEAMSAGYLAAYTRLLSRSRASLLVPAFGRSEPRRAIAAASPCSRPVARRSRPPCRRRRLTAQHDLMVK